MHENVIQLTGYKSKEHIYSIRISRKGNHFDTEERMPNNVLVTNQPFHASFFPSFNMNIT